MSATHKIVNGVVVPLTQEEIDAIEAEWAANPVPTAAELLAVLKERAKAVLDNLEEQGRLQRGVLELVVQEFNLLRAWLQSFKGEVAAAASLADLKTRIATLPDTPPRTRQQVIDAIKGLIDAE